MEQRIKDDGTRPRCSCGRLPKKSSHSRWYCSACERYVKDPKAVSTAPSRFTPAKGYENFALYALTGHFPQVPA